MMIIIPLEAEGRRKPAGYLDGSIPSMFFLACSSLL